MRSKKLFKVGVLVSGRGSNLQALIDAEAKGKIAAKISVVISNKEDAFALERAKKAGIETCVVKFQKGESREEYDKKLVTTLKKHQVSLVVLAGFMRIISPYFISEFPNRIINIHPSLLPAFPGLDVQQKAIDYGVRFSGCTVHFVDNGCDTGPIILQAVVPIEQDDTAETLAARILKEEHLLLPKAVDLLARNKVEVSDRKVEIESQH